MPPYGDPSPPVVAEARRAMRGLSLGLALGLLLRLAAGRRAQTAG